jgi:hypothetical protein
LDPSVAPFPALRSSWALLLDDLLLLDTIPIVARYFCCIISKMDRSRIIHPFIYFGVGEGGSQKAIEAQKDWEKSRIHAVTLD